MRLLFVSHSLPPVGEEFSNVGGMQRVALDLHEALGSRDDVEYRAFVLRSTWRAIHWKVWPFALAAIVFLPKLTRREDTDIVLFSSVITAALALPLKNRFDRSRVKLATIAHGLDVTKDIDMYQRQVPKVFEQMDLVLPVSQATGEACLDRGLARNKMRVVPNGIRL
ncbi:MAG: glycosyltransferase, partial [Rhodothermales bacterium]|nr:glycosyltransferase [Rhodothermales bacterium]